MFQLTGGLWAARDSLQSVLWGCWNHIWAVEFRWSHRQIKARIKMCFETGESEVQRRGPVWCISFASNGAEFKKHFCGHFASFSFSVLFQYSAVSICASLYDKNVWSKMELHVETRRQTGGGRAAKWMHWWDDEKWFDSVLRASCSTDLISFV